jgi:hypothetical protein
VQISWLQRYSELTRSLFGGDHVWAFANVHGVFNAIHRFSANSNFDESYGEGLERAILLGTEAEIKSLLDTMLPERDDLRSSIATFDILLIHAKKEDEQPTLYTFEPYQAGMMLA